MMYTSYHVPANSCTPYELMSKVDKDRSILLRLRCAPLNDFYSILMEDTPGYIQSPHWSKPPIREASSTTSRRNSPSVSGSRSSKSPDHESPIRSEDESPTVKNATSSRAEESSSAKEDVVWGTTDHLTARRAKNLQRGLRVNPIAGEEKGYSRESWTPRRIMITAFMIQD
jgi:hypothetical protein